MKNKPTNTPFGAYAPYVRIASEPDTEVHIGIPDRKGKVLCGASNAKFITMGAGTAASCRFCRAWALLPVLTPAEEKRLRVQFKADSAVTPPRKHPIPGADGPQAQSEAR